MLTSQVIPDTNIIEITLDGDLSRDDYDRVIERIERLIEEHGQVKLIEVVRDIGHLDRSAIWKDFKWSPRHLKDFSHVAVVADQKVADWMIAPFRMFISAEIRAFHLDELDDARAWIQSAA